MRHLRLNRTQGLVLGFFVLAWASLVTILLAAPEVYDQVLQLPASSDRHLFELAFLAALSIFLVLLGVGVVRRWRWTFWLIIVAFLAGVLRVPASILQLSGVLPTESPLWYVLLQAIYRSDAGCYRAGDARWLPAIWCLGKLLTLRVSEKTSVWSGALS